MTDSIVDEQKVKDSIKRRSFSSKFNGVSIDKKTNKYRAYVGSVKLGNFKDESHAAWCYNEYILENFSADEVWMKKLNKITKPEDYVAAKRRIKGTNLPKGISFFQKKEIYIVRLIYRGKLHRFYSKNLEEALAQHQEFLKTIDTLKAENEEKAKNAPIERNTDDIAIIKTGKWGMLPVEERKSQEILVDDEQWHQLMKYTWNITDAGYAVTTVKNKLIKMSRYIIGYNKDDKNNWVDHINQNKIDNRMENLRSLDKRDPMNNHNKKKRKNTSSQYRGVSWCKINKNWQATVRYAGQTRYEFFDIDSEREAARWYDKQAIDWYGITANVNFPLPDPTTAELIAQRKLQDLKEPCKKRQREDFEVGDLELEPVSKLARVVEIQQ